MQLSPFRRSLSRVALTAFTLCACGTATATSGGFDPAFGVAGAAYVDFDESDYASAIARDASGNLFVVGDTSNNNADVSVAKIDSNGHLVSGFGTGGKFRLNVAGNSVDFGYAVALDASGNIYVAGESASDFLIIKLTPAGQLATGFGTGGKVTIDIDDNTGSDRAFGVALDATGNVYAVGTTSAFGSANAPQVAAVKLNASGQRVATFGTNGVKMLRVNARSNRVGSAVVDGAGNLIIGGSAYDTANLADSDAFVLSLSPTGQLVTGFGNAGITLIHGNDEITGGALVRDANGNLFTSGEAIANFVSKFFIAKLDAQGHLVTAFGTGGIQRVDPTDGAYSSYALAAVDAIGNVFLGSYTYYVPAGFVASDPKAIEGGSSHIVVAQLDSTGALVRAFGHKGVKVITLPNGNTLATAIAVDTRKRVYVAGRIVYYDVPDSNYADDLVLGLSLDTIFDDGFDPDE